MQLTYFGTCLHMQCLLNRRRGILLACLIAGVQIFLASPGWTEEVYFGCEYDEETTHEANSSNSGPEKRSNHGKARYAIDWQNKRVQGFSSDKEYELKFSDAELRIQRKTQNSPGERLYKASESIIINKNTGEYVFSEKLEGESSKGRYWYTQKTRKGTCKKID